MTWLAILIVAIVICLSLVIFAPCDKVFFTKDTYPILNVLSDAMQLHLIKDDVKKIEGSHFVEYPDPDMWRFNSSSSYGIYPFYMFGRFFKENIKRCADTFSIAHYVPHAHTMAFVRLGPKSVLKVHKSWKEVANITYRCVLGLDIPANDLHACGIWVQGNAKKIEENKWVIFDASRLHSMFNKQSKPCYMLMFDLTRPSGVGISDYSMPDLTEFVGHTNDPGTE